MKFRAATIKDIATALNLSTSSVSRALRDSHQISVETKAKVQAYAKQINYKPNPIAQGLKEMRSYTIGIIVPEIANSFFSQVINGIESVANQKNYNVLISQSQESEEKQDKALDYMCSRSVDGIIITVVYQAGQNILLKQYVEQGLQIVCVDRVPADIKAPKIVIDNIKAGYDATSHLIKHGYKHIAFIGGPRQSNITAERFEGYILALKKHKLDVIEDYSGFCEHGGLQVEEVYRLMNRLLNLKTKPDAVFVAGDKLTTKCVRYCNERNVAVPQQLAIIGFSNLDLTDLLNPPLSVVRQPAFEMGRLAAEKLINRIESKRAQHDYEDITLATSVTIRESTQKKG